MIGFDGKWAVLGEMVYGSISVLYYYVLYSWIEGRFRRYPILLLNQGYMFVLEYRETENAW